jgi:hypothetical protein
VPGGGVRAYTQARLEVLAACGKLWAGHWRGLPVLVLYCSLEFRRICSGILYVTVVHPRSLMNQQCKLQGADRLTAMHD